METYITIVSSKTFETINPFWAALEKEWIRPTSCTLLYVPEHKKECNIIVKWYEEIVREYMGAEVKTELQIFDDENIPRFIDLIKGLILKDRKAKRKVIIDVTAAEWNYIPATLMLLADENKKAVPSLLYQQYSSPQYSELPYPLIPYTEQKLYDLLNMKELEGLSL